jgi:hypothetical protein
MHKKTNIRGIRTPDLLIAGIFEISNCSRIFSGQFRKKRKYAKESLRAALSFDYKFRNEQQ